ncbi:MAG: M16 family metallopeptidase [Mariniblastus sp.]
MLEFALYEFRYLSRTTFKDQLVKQLKFIKRPQWFAVLVTGAAVFFTVGLSQQTQAQSTKKIGEVEGITEYRLDNGVKLLLFPDNSKEQFTMNMTVRVGSRHEGYGESGMAHLLEHMLFRGTDKHPDIPKLLKDRGVLNMNGTTSIDRTNYFETLDATDDNLKFAIEMEADRLVNSWIKPEHLKSEMTIVRSEFERGENNPQSILMQRIMTAAYQWHNYGKSTIGNRTDIMRVPATNLRVFYRKYYQPDNVTVVIAGKFDQKKALALVEENFGAIPKPERELPKTYTEEPPQDGERNIILRRAGDVQLVGVAYHVPSASSEEYAPTQVLASILSNSPEGPLYKSMVETKIATDTGAFARVGHDPGMLMALAEVPKDKSLEKARDTLIEQLESIAKDGISDAAVKRAVLQIMKRRERGFANTERFATALSEWESYGDWRLYFLHRDRLEKVTADAVREVAKKYLLQSNRTVGMFYPTDGAERAEIDGQNMVAKMVEGYKGREKMAEGEAFVATPDNIQKRTKFGKLDSGMKYALLSKENRGNRVTLTANLHYGDENTLKGNVAAAQMLPQLLSRGTKNLSFQAYRDKLDELKTSVSFSGGIGTITISVESERDNLIPALDVVRQALREPLLAEKEFDIVRAQAITQIESGLSEPTQLAFVEFSRRLDPQPKDDVRYTPTLEEQLEMINGVTVKDVASLYNDFIGGEHGEVVAVGDFDSAETLAKLNDVFAGWKASKPYKRIEQVAKLDMKGERINIDTPDKKNAVYIAGVMTDIGDEHPNYEAMLIGNYIMGGGPLSSRIADRVRKQDGLSYTAMTRFSGESLDERGQYMMFCISNPKNTEKVVSTVREEVDRMISSGVTGEELDKAKESYLTNRQGGRSRDSRLAGELLSNLRTGRTMDFQKASDAKISSLSKEQVDAALKQVINPDRLLIITAGDFSKGETTTDKK